jgi:hypothetical protein
MKSIVMIILLVLIGGSVFAATTSAETNIFSITPQTLPVELSSFTAVQSTAGFVSMSWITESETELMGFRVYRSESSELQTASMITNGFISATNTSTTQQYHYEDRDVIVEHTYYYWLEAADLDGSSQYFNPVMVQILANGEGESPEAQLLPGTGISSIYPNPFNPSTHVSYSVKDDAVVNISVYNHKGQLIRNLVDASIAAGQHRISWDGKDMKGQSCASGIYYIHMNADRYSEMRKTVLMK